ncbi:MAG: hypothetical protein EBS30_18455 [Planctomycetes bacterium]|nr:hypothetical protein [Planctomycetota bacterium]
MGLELLHLDLAIQIGTWLEHHWFVRQSAATPRAGISLCYFRQCNSANVDSRYPLNRIVLGDEHGPRALHGPEVTDLPEPGPHKLPPQVRSPHDEGEGGKVEDGQVVPGLEVKGPAKG